MTLKGLFTAIVTPFNEKLELDQKKLRQIIRLQIESGVNGIVPLGTTGESPTLSAKEKETIIKISVEEAKGKTPVIVGTGTYSTQETIENTHVAAQLGANMALIVSPYYNKPTQEGLYRHFMTIADKASIPFIIYNIPGRTAQNIQLETLKKLATHPKIVGLKESTGNITLIGEVLETIARVTPNFSVLSGDDVLTFPLMSLGGHGVISVVSNLIPREIKQLVDSLLQMDYETARNLHFQLAPLFRAAFLETNPIPIKTAMNMCGLAVGPCRLPLCEMTNENSKALLSTLKSLKLC